MFIMFNTRNWQMVEHDRWQYFAGNEQKAIVALVSRHTKAKWQIEYFDQDGSRTVMPGFAERLSIAKRVVEAKFRKKANAASAY